MEVDAVICAECGREERVLYLDEGICAACFRKTPSLKGKLPWENPTGSHRRRRYNELICRKPGTLTPEEHAEFYKLQEAKVWLEVNPVDQERCQHPDVEPVNEDVARCTTCGDLMVI